MVLQWKRYQWFWKSHSLAYGQIKPQGGVGASRVRFKGLSFGVLLMWKQEYVFAWFHISQNRVLHYSLVQRALLELDFLKRQPFWYSELDAIDWKQSNSKLACWWAISLRFLKEQKNNTIIIIEAWRLMENEPSFKVWRSKHSCSRKTAITCTFTI